jgi:hypothetical protein
MSGGARMLACRKESVSTTETATSGGTACTAGAFIAGATAKHALKHLPRSTPSPQQSSGGVDMLMLSHGMSADCANALAVGPKASQNARRATMKGRTFTAWKGYQRPFQPVNRRGNVTPTQSGVCASSHG